MWSILIIAVICELVVALPPQIVPKEDVEAYRAFLESTMKDSGISLEERMLPNPLAKPWENSGRYQGDILLDEDIVEGMVQQYAARNAYIWPNAKWPGGVIPYEISSGFGPPQLEGILSAMQEIEDNTCIRFRRRTREDRNFVRVTGRAEGCYAHVGYWSTRGVHELNVADNEPGWGCLHHNVIIHEWLHIIGFLHMQSTHDRDNYVRVLWENIWPGLEFNFDKYSPRTVDNLGLPYEYDSNMHYDRYGFSRNGEPTLLPIQDDNGMMGQIDYVTAFDWLRVNRHYNCPGAWDSELKEDEENKV